MSRTGPAGFVAALLLAAHAATLNAAPPIPPLAPQASIRQPSLEAQTQVLPRVTNGKVVPHAPAGVALDGAPSSPNGEWIAAPPPRVYAAAGVLDTRTRQLVVYGGSDNGLLQNTIWTLRLDSIEGWKRASTTTSLTPPPLSYANAIYDSLRDRMLVFGGQDYNHLYNVVWSLDLSGQPEWSLLLPKGPFPGERSAALAVYDSRRNRIIVFGGQGYDFYYNDVWALTLGDTAQWTRLVPLGTPPQGRIAADGIYDPDSDRVLVHGGFVHTDPHRIDASEELWQLRLSDPPVWEEVTPAGIVPPPVAAANAVHDPNHHRMIVTGDGTLAWALDLSGPPAWSAIQPTSEAPQNRGYGVAALDGAGDRILAFGGAAVNDDRGVDVLALDPVPSWGVLGGHPLPLRRFGQATAYDGRRNQMLVFGGISGETYMNDSWGLDLSGSGTWAPLQVYGEPPPPRHEPAGAFDTQLDRMLIYGGWTYPQNFFDDVWALSFSVGGSSWQQISIAGDTKPEGRRAHAVAYDALRNRLYLFGGLGKNYFELGDLWALDLNGTPRWIPMLTIGKGPSPRFAHKLIYDPVRDRLLLCGGTVVEHLTYDGHDYGYDHSTSEVWELPLQGNLVWHLLEPKGYGPSVSDASVVWDGARDRLLVYGGVWVDNDVFGLFVDTWSLQLEPNLEWTQLRPAGLPAPWREAHSGIYDSVHDRMVVFGGTEIFDGGKNDTYSLDFGGASEARAAWMAGSQFQNGRFHSVWVTQSAPGVMATLYRSTDGVTWTVADSRPIATKGEVSFTDVAPDNAWREYYRVGIQTTGGEVYSAPVSINPRLTAVPRVYATYPNPSRDGVVSVDYQLPRSDPARLEILDVRGRLVWSAEILSPGPYVETARATLPGRSGVYFVRVSQLGQSAMTKTVLLQ